MSDSKDRSIPLWGWCPCFCLARCSRLIFRTIPSLYVLLGERWWERRWIIYRVCSAKVDTMSPPSAYSQTWLVTSRMTRLFFSSTTCVVHARVCIHVCMYGAFSRNPRTRSRIGHLQTHIHIHVHVHIQSCKGSNLLHEKKSNEACATDVY